MMRRGKGQHKLSLRIINTKEWGTPNPTFCGISSFQLHHFSSQAKSRFSNKCCCICKCFGPVLYMCIHITRYVMDCAMSCKNCFVSCIAYFLKH